MHIYLYMYIWIHIYRLERAWCLAPTKDANKLAIGYDEGTVVLKLGNERPVASLDTNTGKLIWARSHDIQTMNMKGLNKDIELVDGEKLPLVARDMGACEVYPQSLRYIYIHIYLYVNICIYI
jgi:coatomer subunit beta'